MLGCEIQVQTLPVGDYVLSENVVVERKRGDDFYASLTDTRLFEQLRRLKEAYPCPLIVLEDFSRMFERGGVRLSSLYGALAYVTCRLGIPLLPTRSYEETALVLHSIAKREQIVDRSPVIARGAAKGLSFRERQAFLLEGLENTGPTKAVQLLETFGSPGQALNAILHTKVVTNAKGVPRGIEGPLADLPGFGAKYVAANHLLIRATEDPGEAW